MKTFQLRTLSVLLGALGAFTYSPWAQAQLMFSQYVDGSSNRKGLEIYNPDGATVNLADYEIQQFNNGGTAKTATFRLQGSLTSKQKFLVGRSELQAELGSKVNQVAALSFNGDDAVVLVYKGTPVDRFGRIGERPEAGWGTAISSLGNSFKRIETENPALSIDATAAFDLDRSWSAWTNRNDFSNLSSSTTQPPLESVSCSSSDTPIADLSTAAQNQSYTVRGVITADYRYANGFSGFYIQTPDTKARANVSNAIFVYIPNSSAVKGGQVGDEVILRGRLTTYQNQLQLDQLQQDIQTCNSNMANQVQPISLELPFASLTGGSTHSPQRYQGMLVKLPQTLTVSENYNYGRYGELSLSLGRLYIPTNLYPALSPEAKALAQKNLLSKIIFDDGYNNQNRTPWLPTNFSAANTLRSGYQLKNAEGILEYRFNGWRVQPVLGRNQPEVITQTNPRQNVITKNANHIRVASFNVLNYDNGATGFPTERGATTQAEFDKQHRKIVNALKAIDADVYGLMEIANNGYGPNSAIAHLTSALGSDWKYVVPENLDRLGGDAIAVAIIYNSKRVKPLNKPVVLDLGDKNRTTLAQSFQAVRGNKTFTVIPNHLKSKSCSGVDASSIDADQKDGQGCWNPTRVKAVDQIVQWLAKNPTQVQKQNALLVGDMNSYAKEEPILSFEKANYKVLLNDTKVGQGTQAYSYVFGVASDANGNGGAGNLDHAIADASLYPKVVRTFAWHINADEPTALDYNEEYKTDEQKTLFYGEDAYRSSDHDPVIVDLDLNGKDSSQPDDDKKNGIFDFLTELMNWLSQLFKRN
ncbi:MULTISPECIES: ExeM/NucH family extracellular endonuclease [Acinetobacter]|jgi:predicted extracellular nuclease|uniref:Nuclease n=1 Tax=Acinetobacter pittii TaxID=48296 RepID=A0A242U686_ACIPI|nr:MULTISPECIES: ExeM/NucH family extracellular endonuclease [Acinetobacter]EXS21908.1 endonuclease/Exonuclease/phosphatase family protein [Acinetobacter baumannii 573719]MBJ8472038.1 ExeM/NucH family extracellular endonuclease [Acinetobacter pittii]MBJ8501462.1 ExeM/NucH family extracellular endonuclease [Acinetobacter pittii]MBJ9891677.1 ExeM/NucH family extracellular endonuclease [Acinetobacter pittii]MCU4478129.1 ExeM/NucH family extracellular endonuclease [Acinetobacter sp. WU_MDCI_Abxd14